MESTNSFRSTRFSCKTLYVFAKMAMENTVLVLFSYHLQLYHVSFPNKKGGKETQYNRRARSLASQAAVSVCVGQRN